MKHTVSYTNNRKHLSVPCYFLAPCNKRKHTAHAHQQAASQASTDSAWRHPVGYCTVVSVSSALYAAIATDWRHKPQSHMACIYQNY